MKSKMILASAVVAMMLTACGFGQSATTNTSSSTSSSTTAATADGTQIGKSTGVALDALAAQYRTDGKLDMTNIMNIANMLNVVGGAQNIYENKSDKEYMKTFSKGLIAGSLNIDTDEAAESIEEQLQSIADDTNLTELQDAMKKGQTTATEVQNVANSVSNIVSLFKK